MKQRGFIALISAVIISAILLIVIISGSLAGLYSRFNVLDFESKQRSSALADACVDTLLLRLASGAPTVVGTVSVSGSDSCQILTGTSPYHIEAVFNHSYTDLQVGVGAAYQINSWQEVAHF